MQTVEKENENINPIFDDLERVYAYTSERQPKRGLVPKVFLDAYLNVFNLFKTQGYTKYDVMFKSVKYELLDTSERANTMLVAYSGGKDSTATALYYIDKGYDVILYHLKGINKTYVDEFKNAEKIAKLLGVPYVVEEVKLKGKQEWTEHPLKNWIIASNALQYAIKNKLGTNIAFGNFSTSTLRNDPFEVCGATLWCRPVCRGLPRLWS